jgi:aryl-alcohol dehydrogenase-like predicted oxidoreductase
MKYRKLGKTGLELSIVGLGGHEFHSNGRIKGFQDDFARAVTAGSVMPGFGGGDRRALVHAALDAGINLFDLTIDSEKEAMGRILSDLPPSEPIYLQTRPEGMVYTYDPANRKMADFSLLKGEVQRILGLIRRETIDILNVAFMRDAVDEDQDYLAKIGDNIRRLKEEGLIRFASADTFSGEGLYLRQYASGHFDTTFINYNICEVQMEDRVIPSAHGAGIGILCREVFMKARLFAMAEEAGYTDRKAVAAMAVKRTLSNERITAAMLGVASPEQLAANLAVVDNLGLTDGEQDMIEAITKTEAYRENLARRREAFRASDDLAPEG